MKELCVLEVGKKNKNIIILKKMYVEKKVSCKYLEKE